MFTARELTRVGVARVVEGAGAAVAAYCALRCTIRPSGGGARVHYDLANAKRILTLEADLFALSPESLKNAADYASGRRLDSGEDVGEMNRLYSVEGLYSLTGTNADHRLRLPSSHIGGFLQALALDLFNNQKLAWPASLGDESAKAAFLGSFKAGKLDDKANKFLTALAKDLASHGGASVIAVGEHQPAGVHALAAVLNIALEGFGETFSVSVPKSAKPAVEAAEGEDAPAQPAFAAAAVSASQQLNNLKDALGKGSVKTLVVLGGNPAVTAGAGFAEAMAKASSVIHYGLYADETAALSSWHAPLTHFLEAWGDARAYDGQASVIQPLIEPLHGARSDIELLSQWVGGKLTKGHELVKATWSLGSKDWRAALHDGLLSNTNREELKTARANLSAVQGVAAKLSAPEVSSTAIELVITPDLKVLDGRHSNLGWLQELPDPITKLTWDNAVLVSPALAKQMGLTNKVAKNAYNAEELKIEVNGNSISIPSFVLPGLAENTVVVHTGYGRQRAGDIGDGVGVSVAPLLSGKAYEVLTGAKLSRTGKTLILASTQDHFSMDNNPYQEITHFNSDNAINPKKDRNQMRSQTASDYKANPKKSGKHDLGVSLLQVINNKLSEKPIQMVDDPFDYNQGQQWGMTIDLNSCLGCGACIVACQAENNIPVVGREQVLMGRELHWNRSDRYFSGDVNDPTTGTMPVSCLHCENAPCEPVCPVAATVHGTEGLNTMVYNRCIGTRYCANNCPVKTRRFNYFDYSDTGNVYVPEDKSNRLIIKSMQHNPDVTVRYRGVMEKCTYCTQRIQEAKMVAKRKGEDPRNLPDGAVTPACAQTCATGAVSFGNINNKKSQVAKMKKVDRNYELLKELNIRPRTSYLAKVRNLNPELAS